MRARRSPTQRKLGSSWKPTHMRSAAMAVGAAKPGEHGQNDDEADDTSHEVSPRGGEDGGAEDLRHPSGCRVSLVLATCAGSCDRVALVRLARGERLRLGSDLHAGRPQDPARSTSGWSCGGRYGPSPSPTGGGDEVGVLAPLAPCGWRRLAAATVRRFAPDRPLRPPGVRPRAAAVPSDEAAARAAPARTGSRDSSARSRSRSPGSPSRATPAFSRPRAILVALVAVRHDQQRIERLPPWQSPLARWRSCSAWSSRSLTDSGLY